MHNISKTRWTWVINSKSNLTEIIDDHFLSWEWANNGPQRHVIANVIVEQYRPVYITYLYSSGVLGIKSSISPLPLMES